MRISTNFRLDIRTKKLIKKIYEKSSFKTVTEIVEVAIKQLAKNLGLELYDFCPYMIAFKGCKVFCGKKESWVHFKVCLDCYEWDNKK